MLELFAATNDNNTLLHRRREADGGWGPQSTLPFTASAPLVSSASWAPNRVDIAFKGSCQNHQNTVCQAFWANGAWSQAFTLGTPPGLSLVTSASSATVDHLGVTALLTDGGVAYTAWNGAGWSPWSNAPFTRPAGWVVSAARLLGNGARSTALVTAGPQGFLGINRLDGLQVSWGAELEFPYQFTEPLDIFYAAVRAAPGSGGWLSVYCTGSTGAVRRNGDLGAFGPELALPVPPGLVMACTSSPTREFCVTQSAGTGELYLAETDGTSYTSSRVPPFL